MTHVTRKFEYIDHTGDLGFRAYGRSLEALFAHAAEAFFEVITSLRGVGDKVQRPISLEADALDELMVVWLGELLYLFEVDHLLFRRFDVKRVADCRLEAIAAGEPLDSSRHKVKTTIKAVTYHKLYVKNEGGLWTAQVILDL